MLVALPLLYVGFHELDGLRADLAEVREERDDLRRDLSGAEGVLAVCRDAVDLLEVSYSDLDHTIDELLVAFQLALAGSDSALVHIDNATGSRSSGDDAWAGADSNGCLDG